MRHTDSAMLLLQHTGLIGLILTGVDAFGIGRESNMSPQNKMRTTGTSALVQSSFASETSPTSDIAYPVTKSVLGVIFDIDGTLADSWKLGFDATLVVLQQNGVAPITERDYHEGCVYATPERLARHVGLTPDHPDFDSVGDRLGREFDDLYVGLVSTGTAGFYAGVEELIQAIPDNVRLGALTNACVQYAHAVLEVNCPVRSIKRNDVDGSGESSSQKAIYDRFGSIQGADTVPMPKPAPDGLLLCAEEIGLPPDQCVYVGDSPTDGAAAKAAGMAAIGVLWGSHSEEKMKQAPFDYLCGTVDELKDLLPQKF